ncbi:hypothetical protein WA026_004855 [Henosepilachna vigintioctopunctata]|uniref:protein-tyrosine-phosphatase n=1 Tax=Henosepilachna vigintioctopunctata TaxID=420089 RepID=A0AAW1UTU6_9CUCU
MVVFWNSTSSYLYDITHFEIMLTEEKIWNKTYHHRIESCDVCTTHNLSVPRYFRSSSFVIIKITAVDRNNTRSKTGVYTASSYPPPVNWLNENVSYTSDYSTITVDVKILNTVQKLSSKFLFILIKEEEPSNEDIENVQKLEQKLQTKFYENFKTRIAGIINLTGEDILNLTYQIGNSTYPQLSKGIYHFSEIEHNNKKLKKSSCYNITILPINEFGEKCEFKRYSSKMCTKKKVSNHLPDKRKEWQMHKSIWMIPLILSFSVAIVIFALYKISHSKNRRETLQILVSDVLSTSNVNTAMSNVDGQIGSAISLAVNDYEEIQENDMEGTESIEKYFKKVETKCFEAYVERSLKTTLLQTQHEMFAKGLVYPHEVGMSNENRMKNRYNNLIAYDHSRVKLNIKRETGSSDYINANYINDDNDQKVYIATQGPLPQTVADFWRMIWQERVKSIVMLANIYEDGKKRVEKYWPDEREKKIYGNICIRFRSVELFADYEYRIFSVTCDGEMRQVHQIHFTSGRDMEFLYIHML